MRWFAAVGGSVRWALRPDPLGCAFTDGGESTSLIVAGVTPEGGKSVPPNAPRDARRALPANFAKGGKRGHCRLLNGFFFRSQPASREKGVPATRYNLNQ